MSYDQCLCQMDNTESAVCSVDDALIEGCVALSGTSRVWTQFQVLSLYLFLLSSTSRCLSLQPLKLEEELYSNFLFFQIHLLNFFILR